MCIKKFYKLNVNTTHYTFVILYLMMYINRRDSNVYLPADDTEILVLDSKLISSN